MEDESWDNEPEEATTPAIREPPTPDNRASEFTLFTQLPLELQQEIWKHASAAVFTRCRSFWIDLEPLDYTVNYSVESRNGSRLLSRRTATKVFINNKLFKAMKGRGFFNLLRSSKQARNCALRYWMDSVRKYEAMRDGGRATKDTLVQVLSELCNMTPP